MSKPNPADTLKTKRRKRTTVEEVYRVDRTWYESAVYDITACPSVERRLVIEEDETGATVEQTGLAIHIPAMRIESLELLQALVNDLKQLEVEFSKPPQILYADTPGTETPVR